jgi:hypothetical protein
MRIGFVATCWVVLAGGVPGQSAPLVPSEFLKAATHDVVDRFGDRVAVWGDTLVVGVQDEDSAVPGDPFDDTAVDSGAVLVFVRDGATWEQQAYLKAAHPGTFDGFGESLALHEDTLVVGAPNEASTASGVNGDQTVDGSPASGAAYVFVRTGTTWTQQAYLKAAEPDIFDGFGQSVAVWGDTVVVGATSEDSSATKVDGDAVDDGLHNAGAAYVFERDGTTWSQAAYLKAHKPGGADAFGNAVAVGGNLVAVAAWGEDSASAGVGGDATDDSLNSAGAVYLYVRDGEGWTFKSYLKASHPGAGDEFGSSLALSGDLLVVGASGEQSAATGVDGDPTDDSLVSPGAAYLFRRVGSLWQQEAYLKASNLQDSGYFGQTVALHEEVVAVGAFFEDNSGTGVNGPEDLLSFPGAGAVYVFEHDGTGWGQTAYVKAHNTDFGDFFGMGVAVGDELLVVGAPYEDGSSEGVGWGSPFDDGQPDSGAVYLFQRSVWTNEGSALAGVDGPPVLSGLGTLAAGSDNSASLVHAAPSALAGLFVGFASTPVPFKGGTLLPFPFLELVLLDTGPDGTLPLPFVVPAGIPPGTEVWAQWAIQDAAAVKGVSLSNALLGVSP